MASSITTEVPSGLISEWCIKQLYADFEHTKHSQCANSTRGTKEADFETICCDGEIIDTSQDLYKWPRPRNVSDTYLRLTNLVCCRVEGPQTGGLMPLPVGGKTKCDEGTPIPLLRLAATNTDNAVLYPITYTSASFGMTTTGDFIPIDTPYCLWADTAHGVAMTSVTVPAPDITTMPPPTTDVWGNPIPTTAPGYGNVTGTELYPAYSSWLANHSSNGLTSTATSTSLAVSLNPIIFQNKLVRLPLARMVVLVAVLAAVIP